MDDEATKPGTTSHKTATNTDRVSLCSILIDLVFNNDAIRPGRSQPHHV